MLNVFVLDATGRFARTIDRKIRNQQTIKKCGSTNLSFPPLGFLEGTKKIIFVSQKIILTKKQLSALGIGYEECTVTESAKRSTGSGLRNRERRNSTRFCKKKSANQAKARHKRAQGKGKQYHTIRCRGCNNRRARCKKKTERGFQHRDI